MRNASHSQALREAHAVAEREANRLTFDRDPRSGARLLVLAALVKLARMSSPGEAAVTAQRLAAELEAGRL
jgi:hypothetical protein